MNATLLRQRSRALITFLGDREYLARLFKVGLPIAAQNFVMSALSMVSVVLIGQLGETAVAAVGLANQIYFLLTLVLFGVTSGAAMFTAQLWGKGDIPNIRRVLSLSLKISVIVGLVFLAIAELIPRQAIGVYSTDPEVIALGSDFLSIFGWGFVFAAITISFAAVLRSTGEVKTPLLVSVSALVFNLLGSYLLIFGKLGLPAMGVQGAALSTLAARVLECSLLLWLVYRRHSLIAISLHEIFAFDPVFAGRVLKPVLPVALNELLWSLGITAYSVVYARIGTESIAAMNIVGTIDNLALVLFTGVAHGCAIMVGNWIGAKDRQRAFEYAARSMGLAVLGAVVIGSLLLTFANPILALFKVSPLVVEYARKVLTIISFLLWLRVSNMILFVGIFRSGGDTRFAFILDACIIWAVGVPLAFLGGLVFHLPVYWVYLLVMAEEISKWAIGMWRFFSKKWIHDLTESV